MAMSLMHQLLPLTIPNPVKHIVAHIGPPHLTPTRPSQVTPWEATLKPTVCRHLNVEDTDHTQIEAKGRTPLMGATLGATPKYSRSSNFRTNASKDATKIT